MTLVAFLLVDLHVVRRVLRTTGRAIAALRCPAPMRASAGSSACAEHAPSHARAGGCAGDAFCARGERV
jgi:hypothetical protein